jgi:hypothetical protein
MRNDKQKERVMATLRNIITEDLDAIWRDNAGEEWTAETLLVQWDSDELNREASCVDGQVRFIGADGYIAGAEAVLTEVSTQTAQEAEA